MALCRELEDTAGIARSLLGLGWVAQNRGNYTAARLMTEEALALWREVDDRKQLASSLILLGSLYDTQGEPEGALLLYEESLTLARPTGCAMR